MDNIEILKEYAKQHGYSGFVGGLDCGCSVDEFPACEYYRDCQPAYEVKCSECNHRKNKDFDPSECCPEDSFGHGCFQVKGDTNEKMHVRHNKMQL